MKNLTKDKRVQTRVMVVGLSADGSPLWAATLKPSDFTDIVGPDTTATLTGWATVPKGTLKETIKLWIRVIEINH